MFHIQAGSALLIPHVYFIMSKVQFPSSLLPCMCTLSDRHGVVNSVTLQDLRGPALQAVLASCIPLLPLLLPWYSYTSYAYPSQGLCGDLLPLIWLSYCKGLKVWLETDSIFPLLKVKLKHWPLGNNFKNQGLVSTSPMCTYLLPQQCTPKAHQSKTFQNAPLEIAGNFWVALLQWIFI